MLKWGFFFLAFATFAGVLGFGGTASALSTVAGGMFFVFIAVSIFLFFAHAMRPHQPLRR